MPLPLRLLTLSALLAGALAALPEAHAQFGGGMGGGMGAGMPGPRGMGRGERPQRPDSADADARSGETRGAGLSYEQVAYRLTALQQDLRLSAAQVTTWNTFAERVLSFEADRTRERAQEAGLRAAAPEGASNGLEHLRKAVDAARNRWTALEDIESAARTLYAGLSHEQRSLADMRIALIVAPSTPARTGAGRPSMPRSGEAPAR